MQRINPRLLVLCSRKSDFLFDLNVRKLSTIPITKYVRKSKNNQFRRHDDFPSTSDNFRKIALSPEDDKLINRGDFNGVKSVNNKNQLLLPEVALGKLKEMIDTNLRIYAEFFLINFLLPLEQSDETVINLLKSSPDTYIPFLIRCCGQIMSDISSGNRLKILERFMIALKNNDISLSIKSYNSLLETWLEHDYYFDVNEAMKNAEIDKALSLNVDFFNNLLWSLAYQANDAKIKDILLEMSKRGIMTNFDTMLPQIFSAAISGYEKRCQSLILRTVEKYGQDKKMECISAEIKGVTAGRNIERLRQLLRANVVENTKDTPEHYKHRNNNAAQRSKYILNLPSETIFDVMWLLAKKSIYSDGREYASLTEQFFDHIQRTTGYFKRLFREIERHIAHKYYYSATVLIAETVRLKDILHQQRKSLYRAHMFPKMCNKLIKSRVECDVIWDISNRLTAAFGPEIRFFDDLLYSILMFKDYRYDERFEMFANFVDVIDPDRTRPHLLFPILACCPTLQAKQKILFRFILLGYNDVSKFDSWTMVNTFYKPMLENLSHQLRLTDAERLFITSKTLESFGVKPIHTWKILFDWAKTINENGWTYNLSVGKDHFKKWLQNKHEKLFSDEPDPLGNDQLKFSYALFKKLLNMRDVERIHSLLVKGDGFPIEMNFKEYLDELLSLYLQDANWGYVKKLLQLLSKVVVDESNDFDIDDPTKEWSKNAISPVKNYHLIQILQRYYNECGSISNVIEYVYELKRLFPHSVAEFETRFDSSRAYITFFNNILSSTNNALTPERVNEAIDLVTLLIKMELLVLHSNEILTLSFVKNVLHDLGWDTAVDTWLKFQSSLYCSNGLFALMKAAVTAGDKAKIQFLLHRSKNFISSSRANAYLAGAYVATKKIEKAEEIFQSKDFPLQNSDYLIIFRILQSQKNHETALEYSKLCLKYTDLKTNEHGCHLFIIYWLWLCEMRGIAQIALDFYELFRSYDIPLTLTQMERLDKICNKQMDMINKWIIDKETRVLNGSKSETANNFITRYMDFKKDLEVVKSGNQLRSRTLRRNEEVQNM